MRFLFSIVIVLIMLSCVSEERPTAVLPPDEMVHVLKNIYLMEGKVSRLGLSRDSSITVFNHLSGRLFDSLQINDSVFNVSMNYYQDHPDVLEDIYGRVVDSLNLQEQKILSGRAQ